MSQFLRPDSNVTQTEFTNGYAEIDETSANDSDFAYSADNTAATLEVSVSNPSGTPASGNNTVRYRIVLVDGGVPESESGAGVNVTVSVYEGTTLIASETRACPGTWTSYSFVFASSLVSDWSDLRLRFVTTASGGPPFQQRGCGVSWAEIEAQDPPVSIDPNDIGTAAPVAGAPIVNYQGPQGIEWKSFGTGAPVLGPLVFVDEYPIVPLSIGTGAPVLSMPIILGAPPLSSSTKYAQFFLNSSSCIVQLECVEFIHPYFSQIHRAVRNATFGITVKHEDSIWYEYAYYPLRIQPSKSLNDLDFAIKMEFGDLGEALPQELDLIAQFDGYGFKPIVKLRVFRSDDLETVLHGPLTLEVSEFSFTREGASFDAIARRMNLSRTGELYTLNRFPMLRGFL